MPIWETLSKLLIFDEQDNPLREYVQIELAIVYLIILKHLRKVFLYVIGVLVTLFLICLGLSYLIITLAQTAEPTLAIASVSVVLILIPALIVGALLRQSSWLHFFGAEEFIRKVEKDQQEKRI